MFWAYCRLGLEIFIRQKSRNRKIFNQLLLNNFTIDAALSSRIRLYTLQSTITNLMFSVLRGYRPSKDETACGLLLGAVTPVYDDLMDNYHLSHNDLHKELYVNNPELYNLVDLCQWLDVQIRERITLREEYDYYFKKTIAAQEDSLIQIQCKPISVNDLHAITNNKGGYATLLYRCVLHHKMIPGEEAAIFAFGSFYQYLNDLFDAWKDTQAGSITLITQCGDPTKLRAEYAQKLRTVISAFAALNYPKPNKDLMLRLILTMVSQGFVCIGQFEDLYKKYGHFNTKAFTRKELVCDMDTMKNLYQSYRISCKWYKDVVRKELNDK